MTWYKTGTVTVTPGSNAVAGAGTSFIANARVGDAFRGPDGEWYEVTNIASDTALSIAPDYQGPALSGGVYSIAPMQGYVKASADALRAAVNQYGEKLALLGTTGNYDILPKEKGGTGSDDPDSDFLREGAANKFFTAARVREVTLAGLSLLSGAAVVATDSILVAIGKLQKQVSGKAASGVNNDITSLTGITTPLSTSQGGTGRSTLGALLTDLIAAGAYAKSNILGAVSQTSGNPTGAIIERGSNANGEYVKYADGGMVVLKVFTASVAINSPYGSMFACAALAMGAMAATFARVDHIGIVATGGSGAVTTGYPAGSGGLSTFPNAIFSNPVSATFTLSISLRAEGRWFV